jgi:hypothetical protein
MRSCSRALAKTSIGGGMGRRVTGALVPVRVSGHGGRTMRPAALKPAAFGVTMSEMDDRDMHDASESESGDPGLEPDEVLELEEVEVDGLPVLAEVRELDRASASRLGAIQAAAVAATSFAAGAATLALARRLGARKLAGMQQDIVHRPPRDLFPAGETRTYVVHVRTIRRSWD